MSTSNNCSSFMVRSHLYSDLVTHFSSCADDLNHHHFLDWTKAKQRNSSFQSKSKITKWWWESKASVFKGALCSLGKEMKTHKANYICFLGYIYFHDWIKEPSGGNNVPRTKVWNCVVLRLKCCIHSWKKKSIKWKCLNQNYKVHLYVNLGLPN